MQAPAPEIDTLKRQLAQRDALIVKLTAEIARLKRWRFGRSAERVDQTLAQLQLALDDLRTDAITELPTVSIPAVDDTQAAESKGKSNIVVLRRAARKLPAHLPRETVVHAPAHCNCPDCG